MADATCTIKGCDNPPASRGLCTRHYGAAYRRGQLPPLQLQLPFGIHSLSNLDRVARVADCAVCGPRVPVRIRERNDGGGAISCMAKVREYKRARRKKVSRTASPAQRRRWKLQNKYRITPADYEKLRAEQDDSCAICGVRQDKLSVDHDHVTGGVRGLLCHYCNIALGWLRDDPDIAASAAAYLRSA